MKGMAPKKALKTVKKAPANPMLLQSFVCIGGTSRHIPATRREKRRNGALVKPDHF